MAIFSTNYTAETNTTTDDSLDELGVDLSLSNIPANIKGLLEKVAGDIPEDIPDEKKKDSARPRYALIKGKVAAYAGFYFDGNSIKYDAATNSGTNPFYIASATFTVTAAGASKNTIGLNVKVKTETNSIAKYTVKVNDTTNTVAQGLTTLINSAIWEHGFYASVVGSVITIRATDDVGGSASDLTLSSTQKGTVSGTVTTQFATSVSTASQANRSIDKLTFYIMFRAPFKNNAYNLFYGDPLVQDLDSWSYAANEVRIAHSLKRLNSAGEQVEKVGTVWKNVNDAGEDLDKYTNKKGYEFVGIDVAGEAYLSESKLSITNGFNLDTPSMERTNLFKHVDATQPNDGYNKIPPYFFIVAMRQENPYSDAYWLADKKKKGYSRGAHFPLSEKTELGAKWQNRKFIRFTTSLGAANVSGQIIKKEAFTGSFYVEAITIPYTTVTKYYLQLAAGEQLTSKVDTNSSVTTDDYTYESLSLEGAKVVKKDNRYLAEFTPLADATLINNNSAITFGMGLDVGNAFDGLYKIEFTLAIDTTASGHFRLYYWNNVSDELSYKINASQLKTAIEEVIFSSHLEALTQRQKEIIKENVSVTGPTTAGAINTYTIAINRQYQAAYQHPLYSATDDFSQVNPNVTFNPADDKDRWEIRTDVEKDSWYRFVKTMNYGFSNQPKTSGVDDEDFWLKQNGISATDQTLIKNITKFSLGVSRGKSYAIYNMQKNMLQKVEFKSYVQNMRAIYNEIFIPKYYNSHRQNKDGQSLRNYSATIERNVIGKLSNIHAPNQAELHLMASAVFNNPGTLSENATKFKNAIKSHSLKALSSLVVEMPRDDRHKASYEFIYGLTMIKNIYRGIID